MLLLLLVAAIPGFVPVRAELRAVDDRGEAVRLEAPARRIVTLAPFLTELAFSAGAGAQVVGVSAHSDHPPEAARLPQVASSAGLNLEGVVALRPDLVVAWRDTFRPEDTQRLAGFGIPVFVAQARRLEDAPRLLEALAALAGTDAREAAAAYRARIAALRARHAGARRIEVLLEIWHRPLTTIAGPHWINEALEACGARNAFADLPGVAPRLDWEQVLSRDPQAIVGAGSARDAAEFRRNWSVRAGLAAVRAGRLAFVEADLIQRPTMRLAEGVERLCAGIDTLRNGLPPGARAR